MRIDTRRAIVRAQSLIACEPFQSTETTRYYLNGICIQPQAEGAILIATCGHTLIALRETDAQVSGLETIWFTQAKKRLGTVLTTARKRVDFKRSDSKLDVWADLQYGGPGGATMTAKVAESAQEIANGGCEPLMMISDKGLFVDGTFPEYKHVFRDIPRALEKDAPLPWNNVCHIQAQYLQRAVELAKCLDSPSTAIVFAPATPFKQSEPGENAGPTIVSVSGHPEVRVLLMPCRVGAIDLPLLPEWLDPSPKVETETTPQEEKKAA